MVTARGLPRKPLHGFAGDDREDAGPVEPVDYVSIRFVPYMGQWSQAEPEDIAGALTDGRAERGNTAGEEPPDLEIRVPVPEAMYMALGERVRKGTTPVTGALILSMAQLMPIDAMNPQKEAAPESSEGSILAAASGEPDVTLVSLSLHGPGALSPRMATTLWPAPCETDADPPNDT